MLSKPLARGLAAVACAGFVSSFALGQEAAKADKSGQPAAVVAKETKPRPARAGETYGTTETSYMRIAGSGFTPMQVPGADDYDDYWYTIAGDIFGRYSTVQNGYFLASPEHLPDGALLTYLELDSCDFSVASDVTVTLYDCDYHGDCGAGPVTSLSSANNFTPNACSFTGADISGFGIVVDNLFRQITLRAVTGAGDNTTVLSGVIIGYVLQVSPAPLVATFPDVPTSDFGFQYIEALVKSGITGGCGGGLYCPDSFVTRRQMAIFIAKALGLQWP
jgi:S-layer homology domain